MEKKGEQVVILDVRGLSGVTDFYVIASGLNTPHLKALMEVLDQRLAEQGLFPYRVAGTPESEWIVLDYIDAVVHIFTPRMREYYNLERLWGDARRM